MGERDSRAHSHRAAHRKASLLKRAGGLDVVFPACGSAISPLARRPAILVAVRGFTLCGVEFYFYSYFVVPSGRPAILETALHCASGLRQSQWFCIAVEQQRKKFAMSTRSLYHTPTSSAQPSHQNVLFQRQVVTRGRSESKVNSSTDGQDGRRRSQCDTT